MTPLAERLVARIRATGPLTVAEYMAECVGAYYAARDPFGPSGDFITAPEISQTFGEVIGLALAQAWLDRGAPVPVRLVELGPGRGTLMADILRATSAVPGFADAARVHLVETSPALRELQRRTIGPEVRHHDALSDVPEGPLFLVANEFFDALPVRQFVRDGEAWRERVVGESGGRLAFGLADPARRPDLDARLGDTRDGDLVELSPARDAVAAEIGRRVAASGGVAVVIDYGDWRSLGSTLQAVRRHDRTDPLDAPGEADLTAHFDFEALARAASPARHSRLTPQGVLLERLGITARAQALAAGLTGPALDELVAAHRRLTHPDEMGRLFKAMAIYDQSPCPPGFVP